MNVNAKKYLPKFFLSLEDNFFVTLATPTILYYFFQKILSGSAAALASLLTIFAYCFTRFIVCLYENYKAKKAMPKLHIFSKKPGNDMDFLTPRDHTCLQLMALKMTTKDIAKYLCLSVLSTEYTIRYIKAKLNCRNNREMLALYKVLKKPYRYHH